MKFIIAGSRTLSPTAEEIQAGFLRAQEVLGGFWQPSMIVSGMAQGVDLAGEHYAAQYDIPVRRFPALWDQLGKGAGFARNAEMANYADAALLFWDGKSRGTQHMKDMMVKRKKPVYVVESAPKEQMSQPRVGL